jgi:alanine dehydrogenase
VIGSGFEARMHLRALAAIRDIARARVFSPNPTSRARFVAELADLGVPIESVASGPAAAAGANVVICAARSRDERPTLQGDWIGEDATVVSIGSTLPEQREVDTSVIARAELIVADMVDEVAHDTGDMLAARQAGVEFTPRLRSLSELLGQPSGARPAGLRLYKSVGAALQDLVIAGMCLARARKAMRGTELSVSIAPVLK